MTTELNNRPKPARRVSRLTLRAQPDGRLVTLFREGHEPAFDEIVRRYRSSLVRFAGGVAPSGQAEDAVQDSLVRAHQALRENDTEIALRAWLYTIVRNRSVSMRRQVHPTVELDETINGVPQPPDIFERSEQFRGIVAKLKELPSSQREAIVRTEMGDSSADEIAHLLGTSSAGVGQLVFRARSALRSGAAVLLPLPLVRMLLTAGSGGGAAAGGVAGGAIAGGGGGAALKVGAALVVAAVAVGPGQFSSQENGNRGGTAVEAAAAGPAAIEIEAPEVGEAPSATTDDASTPGGASAQSGSTGSGTLSGAEAGSPAGGGASDPTTSSSQRVSATPETSSTGTISGSGSGSTSGHGDNDSGGAPPAAGGGHGSGGSDDGSDEPADAPPPPPPPPPEDSHHGGGDDGNGHDNSYNDGSTGYDGYDDDGAGGYGGHGGGHN